MNSSFENKFRIIKGWINTLTVIAIIAIICALVGILPTGWKWMFYGFSAVLLVLWIGVNCLYIIPPSTIGVPRIFGKVIKRTFLPGLNFSYPFIIDVLHLTSNVIKVEIPVKEIEAKDSYHLNVTVKYQYKLSRENAWKIVDSYLSSKDGYSLNTIQELIGDYLSKIVISLYRGVDLETFVGNKSVQHTIEQDVETEFASRIEAEFDKTVGRDVFDDVSIIRYDYEPDPRYMKWAQDKELAKLKKQEEITNAERDREVKRILADALNYAMKQKADAESYHIFVTGMKNAEVQDALGKVLRDHPGLTWFEAVKHLPNYLSIGGNTNFDISQFMAVIEDRFGPKPKDAETETTSAAPTPSSSPSPTVSAPAEDADAEKIVDPESTEAPTSETETK